FRVSPRHPASVPRYLGALSRTREPNEPLTVEYRVRTRAGAEVWVRDVGEVGPGDDGELGVHGFLTDISREKELERELAHVRARAETLGPPRPPGRPRARTPRRRGCARPP